MENSREDANAATGILRDGGEIYGTRITQSGMLRPDAARKTNAGQERPIGSRLSLSPHETCQQKANGEE